MLARLTRHTGPWDFVVIGGGATGAGIAVDAASRGYSVVLLEQSDFGKGTSSRSTKLVHGGVRYLRQGNLSLVREALRERAILRRNAPHVVTELPLLVPAYTHWDRVFYGAGLRLYDLLAGGSAFGRSSLLTRDASLARIPTLQPHGLRGGILYHDGQFDDARLLVNLVQTAAEHGAVLLNYVRVMGISANARVDGVIARDEESGDELRISARVVVNATGAFVDGVRRLLDAHTPPMILPSRGTHIVLSREFLPGYTALMVPRVGGGRVMFAIPWRDHTIVGTTDSEIPAPELEPRPTLSDVDALLVTSGRYLRRPPARSDVRSVFTGVRPLVRRGENRMTAALSRDHTVDIDARGLVTTTGGKWTTYRHMAEQTVDRAAAVAGLPQRRSGTASLRIHGYAEEELPHHLAGYGSDGPGVLALSDKEPALGQPLDPDLPNTGAEVVWAARYEMARTVEDVLARRTRALFLNAAAARRMAPAVADLLGRELNRPESWQRRQLHDFEEVVRGYDIALLAEELPAS